MNALHLAADLTQAIRALQARMAAEGARDGDYDVPYTTLHVARIVGGGALNIVPNRAEVDFEVRHLAEDDPEALIAEIAAAAAGDRGGGRRSGRRRSSIAETMNYPGLGTAPDAAVVAFVKGLTGANGTIKVAFGTEGGLFAERLGLPTVVCGPGSMAQGHKPDEFVTRRADRALRGDAGGAGRPAGGRSVRVIHREYSIRH